MPKGLKQTSAVIPVGFTVTESAANTFTEAQVDLALSALDREVFVVLSINLDSDFPDNKQDTVTSVRSSVTSTSQTSIPPLNNTNCLARLTYESSNNGDTCVQTYSNAAMETPPATLDYIGIIATNDFFVQIKGNNNGAVSGANGKLYGYRAVADASIYAALVQGEVLSA